MKQVAKSIHICVKIICLTILLVSCVIPIYAQAGVSSSSVSRSRDNAESNTQITIRPAERNNTVSNPSYNRYDSTYDSTYSPVVLRSNEIRVEEFINYHRHRLPLPKSGEAVALDLRWGNEEISLNNPTAVLQIGFTTPSVNDRQDLPPVNLAVVIDRSGSMQSDAKLEKVKTALLTFVKQLKEQDMLSIITYDSSAQVFWPATHMTASNKYSLSASIKSLTSGGNTNLHGGLILGYQEVAKNYRKGATNRVILLTDGIANIGVTNPDEIASESRVFNNKGIDLSTIGVGKDLNEPLLRELAKSGRGLFHFVANADDINKVFVKEAESLVALIAKRVRVDIEYDKSLDLEKIYGYEPDHRQNGVSITLDDLNYGVTQVIMMKFSLNLNKQIPFKSLPVKVEISYDDVAEKHTVVKSERAFVNVVEKNKINLLDDGEVKKNFTIACLAQAIKDMAIFYEQRNLKQASYVVNRAIKQAYERYPSMSDKDIGYILGILKDYQQNLRLGQDYNVETPNEE